MRVVLLPTRYPPAYTQQVFAVKPPIVYWRMGESSGTVAIDGSGAGRNANYKGAGEPLLGQGGPFPYGTAAQFDGVNDYLNAVAIAPVFNGAQGTVAVWLQMDDAFLTSASGGRWLYWQADASNRIILEKDATNYEFAFTTIFGGTSRGITTLQTDTGWHHYAFTWDKTGKDKQRCYIDGILSNEMGGLGTFAGTLAAPNTNLGATNQSGANPWKGKMAEFAAWDIPLTQYQVANLAHYNGGRQLIFDGDSRTVGGTNAAICYPRQFLTLNSPYRPANIAVGGQKVSDMNADFATEVAPNCTRAVVVIWGGLNDATGGASAATIYASLKTYWAAVRAAGGKVVACTEIDSQGASANAVNWHSTLYPALNTLIKSDATLYDGLADLGANAALQDATNTTYYQADSIHLNTTGYGVVAGIVSPIVAGL